MIADSAGGVGSPKFIAPSTNGAMSIPVLPNGRRFTDPPDPDRAGRRVVPARPRTDSCTRASGSPPTCGHLTSVDGDDDAPGQRVERQVEADERGWRAGVESERRHFERMDGEDVPVVAVARWRRSTGVALLAGIVANLDRAA